MRVQASRHVHVTLLALLLALAPLAGCLDAGEGAGDAGDDPEAGFGSGDGNGDATDPTEPGNGTDAPPESEAGEGASVTRRDVDHGQFSGIREEGTRVVESEDAWHALWDEHSSPQLNPDAPPHVDFDAERVVAVFMGERPDTCHGVIVENVTRDANGDVLVDVLYRLRGEYEMCGDAIVSPYAFIAIPLEDADVRFEKTEVRGEPE